MNMRPENQTGNELRRLRLRLVIDQADQYVAGQLTLVDLAAGIDPLISALWERAPRR
jgi:hypothetical protein